MRRSGGFHLHLSDYRISVGKEGEYPLSTPVSSITLKARKPGLLSNLSNNLRNDASTNGAAAFADGKTKTFIHGDRRNQLNFH